MISVSLFVKSIITISFLWCLAESILPDGALRKNFNFIYGLVLITMAFNIFLNFDSDNLFKYEFDVESDLKKNEYLKELYEERLEAVLREKYNNASIETTLTDDYKVERIYCDDTEIYNSIMRDLNE